MRFITQATKVLNEQKKSKRRLAVFMCLAAVVALGTVAALKMYGQAMSHKEKRLICTVEAHRHTDACYDAEGNLVCGQADYLVHTHNDDCYGADGELVCHLPEIAAHTHTDACYTEEDVLVCTEQEQAHQHTDACYTPQRGELTCQMEEHTHGDDCYDSETGELTCQLEEHQHGDACYAWEEVLTCPYAAGGHQHSSDCYTRERGELTCPLEEHTHGDDCYDENGELACQIEEHTHDDNCYAWEDVLTCQLEETPAGHTHTDACYEKKKVLTCGQLELHTHTEDCYDENGALACGLLELKEHTHQEECFETVELTDEEVAQKLEQEKMEESFQGENPGNTPENGTDSTPDDGTESVSGDSVSSDEAGSVSGDSVSGGSILADSVSGNSVSGDVLDIVSDNDADVHEHDETCYDAAGGLMCGYEDLAEPTITQTYKDENEKYIVTAAYKKDANIPEDAELRAEVITAESDGEHFAKREAEMKETLQDDNVKMDALFKIGFYADGKEVEPESEVMVTVQFLDEEGLADGTPMTIVHFGENGNEVLGGTHIKDKSTTFKTNGFSDFAAIFRKILLASHLETPSGADAEKKDESEADTNSTANTVSPDDASATSTASPKTMEIGVAIDHSTSEGEKQAEELEKQTTQSQTIRVSESSTYKSPDGTYEIDFKIEGKVKLPAGVTIAPEEIKGDGQVSNDPGEVSPKPTQAPIDATEEGSPEDAGEAEEDGATDGTPDESQATEEDSGGTAGSDDVTDTEEETEGDADEGSIESGEEAGEASGSSDEEGAGSDSSAGDDGTQDPAPEGPEGNDDNTLKFQVKCLDESEIPDGYKAVKTYVEKIDKGGEELLLDVLSCSLTYNGEKLDTSECDIQATVRATEKLLDQAYETSKDNIRKEDASATLTFMGVENEEVSKISEFSVDAKNIQEAESTQTLGADQYQLFAARASGQPNPKFTVQYYANLDVVAHDDPEMVEIINTAQEHTNVLPVINTENGRLPKNGNGEKNSPNENKIRELYVDPKTGNLKTKSKLTEVYEARKFEYHKAPTINYINALIENVSYKLKEVWVLKTGGNAESVDKKDWETYTYDSNLHFTNRSLSATDIGQRKYILIKDNTVLRLVYDTTTKDRTFNSDFYDYDIGDGKIYKTKEDAQNQNNGEKTSTQGTEKWFMSTAEKGINSPGNYSGTGAKFAFGNANTGSGLQHELWPDNSLVNLSNKNQLLNKLNAPRTNHPAVEGSYKGCMFGMVTGLNEGKIQYASGIQAPNLFNEGTAIGKTPYENKYTLNFNRVGDTHTLTAVNGTDAVALDTFKHPQAKHTHIWTNNFWPMDSAPSYGTDGHDMKFGNSSLTGKRGFGGKAGTIAAGAPATGDFPPSDDNKDHNAYFGMHYQVKFDLAADYVGPLEYYFFGDDDMWVFLSDDDNKEKSGTLVCDIGGVHLSVGEYLNLWDYINKEEEGLHRHTGECYKEINGVKTLDCGKEEKLSKSYTLDFFYTERGESGSTCWMQFTLPSVTSLTPETTDEDYGHLKIEKTVTKIQNGEAEEGVENNDKFSFTINFTDAKGNKLPDDYPYVKYDKDGKEIGSDLIIWDGGTFELKNGEYIIVKYLPPESKYKITETNGAFTITDNTSVSSNVEYFTDVTVGKTLADDKKDLNNNKIAEGNILSSNTAEVKYNNKFYVYNLPKTGGPGTYMIYAAVALLTCSAALLKYRQIRRRREGVGR